MELAGVAEFAEAFEACNKAARCVCASCSATVAEALRPALRFIFRRESVTAADAVADAGNVAGVVDVTPGRGRRGSPRL